MKDVQIKDETGGIVYIFHNPNNTETMEKFLVTWYADAVMKQPYTKIT